MLDPTTNPLVLAPNARGRALFTAVGLALVFALLSSCSSSGGSPSQVRFGSLTGTTTAIALNHLFLDRIDAGQLTPTMTGTASDAHEHLYFPITAGTLTTSRTNSGRPRAAGAIQHDGSGITLTRGQTTVAVRNLRIDLGHYAITALVAIDHGPTRNVTLLNLTTASGTHTYDITRDGPTVILKGTHALFSAAAAQIIEQMFGPDIITTGLDLGDLRIEIHQ